MFNINWNTLVQRLMPGWWRKPRFIAWLLVLLKPVEEMHAALLAYRTSTTYNMRITGQTIYLEQALNDRFDAIDREIYIENLEDLTQLYIYNKVEANPPLYLYNKWDVGQVYATDQFAIYGGIVWQALASNSNSVPAIGNTNWTDHKVFDTYLRNKQEVQQQYDFIVWVPLALVFDEYELRALIDTYRKAGTRYTIQTF